MTTSLFATRQIGDFQVTALRDGALSVDLNLLSGIRPAEAERLQHQAGVERPANIPINAYLIRGRGLTILVDTGTGGLNGAGGQLQANLALAGISPDEVDMVLLTHGHPDHIGGLLDGDGCPVYRHARLYIHPLEVQYWQDDAKFTMASERGQRNFIQFRRSLDAYKQSLSFIGEQPITEGITPVWLPGHTPGHSGFRIHSAENDLLIWGDIVHFPHIQSTYPDVSIAFDVCAIQAGETRKKILARAAEEKWLIAGMHLGPAGFARVENVAGEYRLDYSE